MAGEALQARDASFDAVFFRAGGLALAVDAAEVAAMVSVPDAEASGYECVNVEDALGLDSPPSRLRRALVLRPARGAVPPRTLCVVVNEPDGIGQVGVQDVRPLPAMLGGSPAARRFWAGAVREGGVVLLASLRGLAGAGG
jgi:hypothetical protein